jgi:hypothetical protein
MQAIEARVDIPAQFLIALGQACCGVAIPLVSPQLFFHFLPVSFCHPRAEKTVSLAATCEAPLGSLVSVGSYIGVLWFIDWEPIFGSGMSLCNQTCAPTKG